MKRLVVLFLGILMVVSLVGCGGGGGGGGTNPPETGAVMDAATKEQHFTEANKVNGAIDMAGNYLDGSPTESSETVSLEWSTTQDSEGWYSAPITTTEEFEIDESEVEITIKGTAKMRYLASTETTQIEISGTGEYGGQTGNAALSSSISKGTNGFWNGYVSIKANLGEHVLSEKKEFKNVNATNGIGEYIYWENEAKTDEFTISADPDHSDHVIIAGKYWDETGEHTFTTKSVPISSGE